jgi:hypothetical protein
LRFAEGKHKPRSAYTPIRSMPRTALPWLIVAAVLVSAALAWWTLTGGMTSEPRVRSEQRESLPPFHEVEIGGKAEVTLLQSDGESIEVKAGTNGINVEVADGRLLVRAQDRRRWWSRLFGRRSPGVPQITLRFRTLDVIALTGSVRIDVPKLEATSLRIAASGGSRLSIGDLRATSLRVNGSGALDAKLAGRVEKEDVSISGAGSYRAEELVANDASVSVSGVGDVVVHATNTLRASISGAGVIEYLGNPTVTEHVSGIGRVKRRDGERASTTTASASAQWIVEPSSLKNSGPPVTTSTSSWTPAMKRTSATRQSRRSASSTAATSCTVSYG